MLKGSDVAVVGSNSRKVRNGDQFYPYRQHSDFFYLSGISQPDSILVLTPGRTVLFIRKPDPKTQLWSGPLLSREEASSLSGIGDIRWMEYLGTFFEKEIRGAMNILPGGEKDGKIFEKLKNISPIDEQCAFDQKMMQLRMIKQVEEIAAIKNACSITRSAFMQVLKKIKPGMPEYKVEAELSAEFIGRGAQGHAFEPIVASGENALILHYVENEHTINSGDLLLMDFGAELYNYAADCSRTLPVNGRFSKRQRELYKAVLRVFKKARAMMRPGILMGDFHKQVGSIWEEEHVKLGLYSLEEARANHQAEPLWKKYYMHGTSHSLGLDVHDPFDRTVPFAPGMVLTCEPGIYIEEEGIGIRLENDILITENEPLDLMEDIPMEVDEIEDLMQSNERL